MMNVNAYRYTKLLILTGLQKRRVARTPKLIDVNGPQAEKDDDGNWIDNENIRHRTCKRTGKRKMKMMQRELDASEREGNKNKLSRSVLLELLKPSKCSLSGVI
jgi:hypothetical protein